MQPPEGAATLFSGVRETCQNLSRLWSLRKEVTTYTKPVVPIKLVSISLLAPGFLVVLQCLVSKERCRHP